MKHKVGDYVLVKSGTEIKTGEQVENWGGKIVEVNTIDNICHIEFDSITLKDISDTFLINCYEDGSEAFQYIFLADELLPARRRDNEAQLDAAIDDMHVRIIEHDHNSEEKYDEEKYDEELEKKWIETFLASEFYQQLTARERENADFIISTFMGYMWSYCHVNPPNWTPDTLEEICSDVVPRKVSTGVNFFKDYGKVLITFLHFLDKEKHISNATSLIKRTEVIRKQISQNAANSENWGMAKSMMMEGNTILNINVPPPKLKYAKPLQESPYKNIGRNDKINVKYTDGKIVMDVKFKKVQKDLLGGLCEIVKG